MAVFESPSAETRLRRAATWLADRQRERGEDEVVILGASFDAASEVARRALGRASFGWQRTTLSAHAAVLARPELVRRELAPASALALEALCARVVHARPEVLGRFAAIRERPGLPRALARTLGELRLAGVVDPELAPLLAAYEEELARARLADRAQVLALATAVATPAHALLLVDVPLRARAEADFVRKLGREMLAVVPSGDARTRELLGGAELLTGDEVPLANLQAGLFGSTVGEVGGEVTVLSAPGESRECVEMARIVHSEAAKGTPFDRMAVLLRAPGYGPLVAEAFRRAGIPAHFARGAKRPHPAGRAFLALLACAAEQLSARRFSEYLSLGEVPEGVPPPALPRADRVATPDDETLHGLLGTALPPPEDAPPVLGDGVIAPRHWERLLVEAAVIGEASRWKSRLEGLAAKLAGDAAAYDAKDEAALAETSRRELAAVEALQRFALPLVDDLAALPARAPWSTWLDALGALATRALRHPERVLAVLAELEPLGSAASVDIREVRLVLEPRLTQLLVPETGRRYGRVFVGTTDEARGLAFDVVFVPGLAEKIFPQKVVEDPLLLDDARKKLSPDLPTNRERSDEERLALRLAIGAGARRVVLSYPRVDVEQARPRTPSFYGLEVLRVAEGKLGDFEHLAQRAAATADARIGWPAPRRREDAIDEAEYDLALLKDVLERDENEVSGEGHYLVSANPHLARALRHRWARWGPQLRSSDGFLYPPPEALAAIHEHTIDKRSFSPTALQNFAACPYRFFLSAVHKLAPREELDAIEDLDPLTKGSLVHDVLYRLHTTLRDDGQLPITEANLELTRTVLDRVLEEVEREYRERLHPAIDRVWRDSIAGIGADLREWLRRAVHEDGWVPAHFELSFGLKDPRSQDARSTDEPVALENGLRLRGSIDLVERKGKALRATDYKTGKVRAQADAVIGGGEILQPVLYALALEKLFPDTPVDGGILYYCTSAGAFEKKPVALDDTARSAAQAVAKTVGDALTRGFLPAAPAVEKKGRGACTYCDFRPICGPYEEIRIRKKPQEHFRPLERLRKHR